MNLFEKIKQEWIKTLEEKKLNLQIEKSVSLRTKLLLLSGAIGVFKEVKMEGKSVLLSKTLWANLLALIAGLIAGKVGVELPTDWQVTALAVINIILRLVTKQPVVW